MHTCIPQSQPTTFNVYSAKLQIRKIKEAPYFRWQLSMRPSIIHKNPVTPSCPPVNWIAPENQVVLLVLGSDFQLAKLFKHQILEFA